MTLNPSLPLAEAKNKLSEAVDTAEREHARYTITKHGRPAAVLLGADDFEALQETLSVLGDLPLMERVSTSLAELAHDRPAPTTKAEFLRRADPGA